MSLIHDNPYSRALRNRIFGLLSMCLDSARTKLSVPVLLNTTKDTLVQLNTVSIDLHFGRTG